MATFKKIEELPVITEIPDSAKVVIYDPEQLIDFNKVSTTLVSTLLDISRGTYADIAGPIPIWNQDTTGNAETANHVPYSGLVGPIPIWNQDTTGNADTATFAQISDHSNTSNYALHANSATYVVNATYVTTANTADHVPYSGLIGDVPIWNQDTAGTSNNSIHFGGELPSFFVSSIDFDSHLHDSTNSHNVTSEQVGLGNVTNESKTTMFSNPTFTGTVGGITKSMVGLGNVDNTSDTNKPLSTAQQSALDLKATKASPTFTGNVTLPSSTSIGNVSQSEISYLVGTSSNIQTQINTKAPIHSPTFTGTVSGISKDMVGLGSVDNTGDEDKPVSSATQNALDLKADLSSPALTGTPTAPTPILSTNTNQIATTAFVHNVTSDSVKTAVENIIDSAPGALDSINELASALGNDPNYATTITTALSTKSPIYSPSFTGIPTAPTADANTNTTQIATTEFVQVSSVNIIDSAPNSLNTLGKIAEAIGNDSNYASNTKDSIGLKADIESPTFTGTVSGISKDMVGLGNVDNTSDADKPVSSATQNALDLKADLDSPTFTGSVSGISKDMVGLGNVDNTSDEDKPVSSATQNALDLKADIESPVFTGVVSLPSTTNIGTTNLGYFNGVTSNIQTQINTKAPIHSPTFTGSVSGISKSMVGLGNVDNTSDEDKPVSSATQNALDLKADLSSPALTGTPTAPTANITSNTSQIATTAFVQAVTIDSIETLFGDIVDSAPKDLDTMGKIAKALGSDSDYSNTISNALDLKAPLNSPILTGTPTAPTVISTSNNNQVATTAFVKTAISNLVASAPGTLDTLNELAAALGDDPNYVTTITTALSTKASIESPTFTGTVSGISKDMVGLGNVDNTSDADKPVSSATQNALDLKSNIHSPTFTGNVSGITKTMVGLGGVDNTSDEDKPVSSATQNALDLKADLNSPTFTGNVTLPLTTNIGTTNLGYFNGVTSNIQTQINTKAPIHSPTFTGSVSGISKDMVGLANVDNTSDEDKPVSSAQQSALDLKADLYSPNLTGVPTAPTAPTSTNTNQVATTAFVSDAVANLISSAPGTLDTLNELAAALGDDPNYATTVTNALGAKAPLQSPALSGVPTAPTAPTSTNTNQVATTAFVNAVAYESIINIVDSAPSNLDTIGKIASALGNNYNYASTITDALDLKADLDSPTFTGSVSGITNEMVGLGNVDNTSDSDKPVSIATQNALDLKADLDSPTFTGSVSGITNEMVGLGNVDNTSDSDKPVSSAQQNALDLKSNIASPTFTGNVTLPLTTNIGTTNLGYFNGVTSNVQTQINVKAPIHSPTFTGTVSGISKSMVGLGNVDNTSDANKPVSTATQVALNLKADLDSPNLTGVPTAPTANTSTNNSQVATTEFVHSYTTEAVANLIDSTPSALNTLNELAAALGNDPNYATTITTALGSKAPLISPALVGTPTAPTATPGTNSTQVATTAFVNISVNNLVDSAPDSLNTLDKIAAAIGDDYNYCATVSASLSGKADVDSPTFTGTVSGITREMVGLPNVDNTSDLDKPVSTYQQAAFDLKADVDSPTFTGNVKGIAKSHVGLGNVDNTSDINKPVSTATQESLDLKSPIASPTFTGNVTLPLTTNIGTTNLGYFNGVTSNVQTQINTKAPIHSPTFTGSVSGITKSMVGLGSVDNTSDADKPVSTATQQAINNALVSASLSGIPTAPTADIFTNTTQIATTAFVNSTIESAVANLIDSAPVTLNTLNELSLALGNDPNYATTITNALGSKAPIDSPALTGTPTAPTAPTNASSTQVATTAFVKAVVSNIVDSAPNNLDTIGKIAVAIGGDSEYALNIYSALDLKADLDSPTFTGSVSGITNEMVGLGNVDNTSDNDKPVSTATQNALDLKADLDSPTFTGSVSGITNEMVGLGNVDNTSDNDKPVSTATQDALDLKSNIASPTFTGTVTLPLTTNIGDTNLGYFNNVTSNVQTQINTKAPIHSPTFTGDVAGITKSMVGLDNVDNTSDLDKPISNDTRESLDLKADIESPNFSGVPTAPTADIEINTNQVATTEFVHSLSSNSIGFAISNIVGSAPTTLNTLNKLASSLGNDAEYSNTVSVALSNKADLSSPALIGTPTAPTAEPGTNTTQISTTAFVQSAIANLIDSAPGTLNTLNELAAALGDDPNYATTITTALGSKAPIASPTFTGTVSGISKSMVGLGSVDNTSDANKPVSAAQQSALDLKAPIHSPTFTGTVYGISKSMVGLGSVDNTSDANKPVSAAQQSALDLKAPIASPTFTGTVNLPSTTNIGTTNLGYFNGVTSNIQTQINTKAPIHSPTFTGTVGGIDKTMVGLNNIDNTSDDDKPVSNAQQAALNLKSDIASPTFNTKITTPKIIGGNGSTDSIDIQGTSGNGNLTSTSVNVLVGNNGDNTAITVLNNGYTGFGVNPTTKVQIKGIGTDRDINFQTIDSDGNVLISGFDNGSLAIGTVFPTSILHVVGLMEYVNNAHAVDSGLSPGAIYRTGDLLKVVH